MVRRKKGWFVSMTLAFCLALAGAALAASKEDARRAGYDFGYRDGVRQAEQDGRYGGRSDNRSVDKDRADRWYSDRIGHRGDFRDAYQDGYEAGYRQARQGGSYSRGRDYGRDDRYGSGSDRNRGWGDRNRDWGSDRDRYGYENGRGVRSAAFDAGTQRGYTDGLRQGQDDRNRNRGPDIWKNDDFRDGDNGYRSSYGDKLEYQNGYRQGFEQGYRSAYQGGRYRY